MLKTVAKIGFSLIGTSVVCYWIGKEMDDYVKSERNDAFEEGYNKAYKRASDRAEKIIKSIRSNSGLTDEDKLDYLEAEAVTNNEFWSKNI